MTVYFEEVTQFFAAVAAAEGYSARSKSMGSTTGDGFSTSEASGLDDGAQIVGDADETSSYPHSLDSSSSSDFSEESL